MSWRRYCPRAVYRITHKSCDSVFFRISNPVSSYLASYDDLQRGHVCVLDRSMAIFTAGAHNSSLQWHEKHMPTNLFSYHLVVYPGMNYLFCANRGRAGMLHHGVRMNTSAMATIDLSIL